MCKFIGMEYLTSMALSSSEDNTVSLKKLSEYSINVMKACTRQKIEAVALCSNKYAIDMVHNNPEFFSIEDSSNDIIIKRVVDKEALIKEFASNLSVSLLEAFAQADKSKL